MIWCLRQNVSLDEQPLKALVLAAFSLLQQARSFRAHKPYVLFACINPTCVDLPFDAHVTVREFFFVRLPTSPSSAPAPPAVSRASWKRKRRKALRKVWTMCTCLSVCPSICRHAVSCYQITTCLSVCLYITSRSFFTCLFAR